MMFRKWMLGACVAVATMAAGGATQAQGVAYTSLEVRVNNKSAREASVSEISGCVDIPGCGDTTFPCCGTINPVLHLTVAPYSATTVTLPVDFEEEENHRVVVKVKNRPAKVLKIKRTDVLKLMQKSGFTSGVHPTFSAVVDKYSNVTFGRVYLKKDVEP